MKMMLRLARHGNKCNRSGRLNGRNSDFVPIHLFFEARPYQVRGDGDSVTCGSRCPYHNLPKSCPWKLLYCGVWPPFGEEREMKNNGTRPVKFKAWRLCCEKVETGGKP